MPYFQAHVNIKYIKPPIERHYYRKENMMANYQELAQLVWNVADDVLRNLFKQHEYGDTHRCQLRDFQPFSVAYKLCAFLLYVVPSRCIVNPFLCCSVSSITPL